MEMLSILAAGEPVALSARSSQAVAAEEMRAKATREEGALVDKLRAGSEEAFAELIAQFGQPLYSLLARSLQDSDDAADLTQEVFLKVFRGIRNFHGEASLRTWIYKIALHEASNRRRWWTRHRRGEMALDQELAQQDSGEPITLGETLADAGASPFDNAASHELKARVEAALAEVPEPFRTAVVLRDIEGFAYDEMAAMLDINIGTVKSRIVRGRTMLKTRLAEFVERARQQMPLVARQVAR